MKNLISKIYDNLSLATDLKGIVLKVAESGGFEPPEV